MASLQPELIFSIGDFPVTNTILATIAVDIVLVLFVIIVTRKITLIPNKFQNAVEMLISYFYDMTKGMAGTRTMAIFPWVMTFFIFIVFSNFLGLLPGIGSIGITPKAHESSISKTETAHEETVKEDPHEAVTAKEAKEEPKEHLVSLLRPATSDFNATLALAVISLIATHALSIRFTGLSDYLSRYFVLNPIMLFVGLLELVSEFIKIFSLSFRLFGNIYAGEVVLATISGLFAFLAPLPFLLLESIVAIVQALVFSMLTLVFMSMLTQKHHGEEH